MSKEVRLPFEEFEQMVQTINRQNNIIVQFEQAKTAGKNLVVTRNLKKVRKFYHPDPFSDENLILSFPEIYGFEEGISDLKDLVAQQEAKYETVLEAARKIVGEEFEKANNQIIIALKSKYERMLREQKDCFEQKIKSLQEPDVEIQEEVAKSIWKFWK